MNDDPTGVVVVDEKLWRKRLSCWAGVGLRWYQNEQWLNGWKPQSNLQSNGCTKSSNSGGSICRSSDPGPWILIYIQGALQPPSMFSLSPQALDTEAVCEICLRCVMCAQRVIDVCGVCTRCVCDVCDLSVFFLHFVRWVDLFISRADLRFCFNQVICYVFSFSAL